MPRVSGVGCWMMFCIQTLCGAAGWDGDAPEGEDEGRGEGGAQGALVALLVCVCGGG